MTTTLERGSSKQNLLDTDATEPTSDWGFRSIDWGDELIVGCIEAPEWVRRYYQYVGEPHQLSFQPAWQQREAFPDFIIESGSTTYFAELKSIGTIPHAERALTEEMTTDPLWSGLATRVYGFQPSEEVHLFSTLTKHLVEEVFRPNLELHPVCGRGRKERHLLSTARTAVRGTPQALLEAIYASPHLDVKDVDALFSTIEEGKHGIRFDNQLS